MNTRSALKDIQARITRKLASRLHRLWFDPCDKTVRDPIRQLLGLGSALYGAGLRRTQRRALACRCRLPAFVISVGNVTVGGTGKTPMTLRLAGQIAELGFNCAILSRGYGRQGRQTGYVQPTGDICSQMMEYGDEPVLLAHRLKDVPVRVGKRRCESGLAAIRQCGAQVLILDDGFQHLAVDRDLDLVLLDAENPFGNGELLPAGPMREPASSLKRADAVILTRADNAAGTERTRRQIHRIIGEKPLFSCRHTLKGFRAGLNGPLLPIGNLAGGQAVMFSGIANPGAFFRSVENLGVLPCRSFEFPDHHRFDREDITALLKAVHESRARCLITTEKDAVRLPPAIQSIVAIPELDIDFGPDEKPFRDFLALRLPL